MFANINLFGRPQNERATHVNALQKVVPSAHVAAEDYSLVDVTYGASKRMRVFLPPRFPQDKPVLQLMEATRHPNVDKYNQVHVPYLDDWGPRHSLSELVTDVLAMLLREDESSQQTHDAAQETTAQETTPANAAAEVERPASSYVTPLPEIPGSFADVEAMDEAEAQRYLDDDEAFQDLFETVHAVKSLREVRDALRESNAKLARDLVADVERQDAVRAVARDQQTSLVAEVAAYDALQTEARAAFEPPDLARAALETHRQRADHADRTSETLCDNFRAGDLDLLSWHKLYLEQRIAYHSNEGLAHAFKNRQDNNVGGGPSSFVGGPSTGGARSPRRSSS
mmetsp:Transcript_15649/g.47322  ORF Transcript_15649/g.47322 Transcript_15649/m.47322 type:complete len:341 (-) Transcript_15649:976-1998(-)